MNIVWKLKEWGNFRIFRQEKHNADLPRVAFKIRDGRVEGVAS